MLDYNSLLIFFKQYNEHYIDFLDFERKKLKLVAEDDINGLTDSIKTEQALIMKTNSFETKRMRLLADGGNGKTFSDLINEAPDQYKDELTKEFRELSKLVLDIKKVNDNVRLIVTERMKKYELNDTELDTYTGNGQKNHSDEVPHTILKSV